MAEIVWGHLWGEEGTYILQKYTFTIVLILLNDLMGEGGLKLFNWKIT